MNKPTRKPLRRTAWTMLLGGLAGAALILGMSACAGEPAGPGHTATWPAGTEIGVFRSVWRIQLRHDYGTVGCTVNPQSGPLATEYLPWSRPVQPDFAGPATITCDQPARVLTDPLLTIARHTSGSLFLLPLVVALVGGSLFLPRGNPKGGEPLPFLPPHPHDRP